MNMETENKHLRMRVMELSLNLCREENKGEITTEKVLKTFSALNSAIDENALI